MRPAILLALAAALAAAGCKRAPPAWHEGPRVHLSTERPDSNLDAVIRFVRATCIDAVADPGAIAGAIEDQRWPAEQDMGSVGQIVAVRDLEHGRIAYAPRPIEVAGARFGDCQIELDGAVSPGIDRMRDALRAALRGPGLREAAGRGGETIWRWQPGPSEERELILSALPGQAGARPGLNIRVGSTRMTLAPLADENPDAAAGTPANGAAPAPEAALPADDAAAPDAGPDAPPASGGRWGNGAAPQ